MKNGVRPGLRVLFFATLLAASIVVPSHVAATDGGQSSSSSSSQSAPAPATPLLYRVRYGAPWRGEIADRFYIERNIALAATTIGITGDDDPDGDGWAIVGHTDTDYDGRKISGFGISPLKIPYITLNWNNDQNCALLWPISLDIVQPDQDRLLRATIQRMCFAPATNIGVTILTPPLEPVTQAITEPLQPQLETAPQQLFQPNAIMIEPAEPGTETVILDPTVTGSADGHVEAASTTTVPNYFDGPGKNSAEVATDVGNSFLIGASIIFAVLLGAVFLVRFLVLVKS